MFSSSCYFTKVFRLCLVYIYIYILFRYYNIYIIHIRSSRPYFIYIYIIELQEQKGLADPSSRPPIFLFLLFVHSLVWRDDRQFALISAAWCSVGRAVYASSTAVAWVLRSTGELQFVLLLRFAFPALLCSNRWVSWQCFSVRPDEFVACFPWFSICSLKLEKVFLLFFDFCSQITCFLRTIFWEYQKHLNWTRFEFFKFLKPKTNFENKTNGLLLSIFFKRCLLEKKNVGLRFYLFKLRKTQVFKHSVSFLKLVMIICKSHQFFKHRIGKAAVEIFIYRKDIRMSSYLEMISCFLTHGWNVTLLVK